MAEANTSELTNAHLDQPHKHLDQFTNPEEFVSPEQFDSLKEEYAKLYERHQRSNDVKDAGCRGEELGATALGPPTQAEITDENLLNQLEKFRKATCLIEADEFKSTGFHFGSGWLMSVAHAFQNDDVDTSQEHHSLLPSAKFTFHVDNKHIEFPPPSSASCVENRVAIIHHLQPGPGIDAHNMDIAMVKLGIQYEYGRPESEYKDWEKDEEKKLEKMGLGSVFANIKERQVTAGDKVYAIFSSGENGWKEVEQTVKAVKKNQPIPTVVLQPPAGHRASGCPILNEDRMLVGLLVGGDDAKNVQGEDDALMWNGGIKEYVTNCAEIIAVIGSYMTYEKSASQEKAKLKEKAKELNLTIYLMNGEELYGEN